MTKPYAFMAATVFLGAALALPSLAAGPASGLTAEQIIAARQASYDMSAVTFGSMVKAMKAGGGAKEMAFSAHALTAWSKALPTMFPAGTGAGQSGHDTKALAAVWSNRDGFNKAAANYAAATDKLANLADAGDTPGFTAQLGEVKKACDACHQDFRQR